MSASLLTRCQRRLHHEIGFAQGLARRGLATEAPKNPRLAVGILLNRSPFLTRTPTKFEREFYKYQQRIQRALHNPFPHEFYFKQGSVLEAQFTQEEINREKKAYGDDFVSEEAIEKASLMLKVENTGEEEEKPMPRRTEADDKVDMKSLDRFGTRNLYLLVKGSPKDNYEWRFPKGYVGKGELLHEAAKRNLHAECGSDMNTWIVGRRPIGFLDLNSEGIEEKEFFFKAHIFAGQVRTQEQGITDFAWLTKQEIQSRVAEGYWLRTKDMLSDF